MAISCKLSKSVIEILINSSIVVTTSTQTAEQKILCQVSDS